MIIVAEKAVTAVASMFPIKINNPPLHWSVLIQFKSLELPQFILLVIKFSLKLLQNDYAILILCGYFTNIFELRENLKHIIIKVLSSKFYKILWYSIFFVFIKFLVFFSYLWKKDRFILAIFRAGRTVMTRSNSNCLHTVRRQNSLIINN